ncbi:MAG: DUF2752 domain-containing protein [Actinobacteria bacterium]|nr:DUF2752 domain-containing protein [Actinomycetota bacterium]
MDTTDITPSAIQRVSAHRYSGPVIVGLGAVALMSCIAIRDPQTDGAYPLCIFRAITGLDCPGCGSLRALHALTRGDVWAALDQNVLLVAVLPFLVWRWVAWVRSSAPESGTRPRLTAARWIYVFLGLVVAFWVVRNIPGVPFIGSGIG